MDSLIKALPALLKASRAPEEVAEAACVAMWREAVGEGLMSHAVPVRLSDQKLVVAVEDSLWKKQLEHMRGQLLFRLNSVLGQSVVTSIDLRIDPDAVAASQAVVLESEKKLTNFDVPPELMNVAAQIEDVDLRRAFLGAATSCIRRIEKQSEI